MRKTLIPLLVLLAIAVAWVAFQPTESTNNLDELTLGELSVNNDVAEAEASPTTRAAGLELPNFDNRQIKSGKGSHAMSGIVVDENNNPVPGCWVAAYSVPFPLLDFEFDFAELLENPLEFNLEPLAAVFADEQGHFDLSGLHGRTLYLTARTKQRLTPRRQRVLTSQLNQTEVPVIVRTVAAASLGGKVLDAGGAPVAGAEVLIGPGIKYLIAAFRNRTFFMEKIYTDADGSFEIEAVPAGAALTINAWRGGVEGGMREFGPLAANTHSKVTVSMFALGTLAGEVVDKDDQPIAGADVVALPLDLRLAIPFIRDPMVWTARTSSNGSYRFPKLPHAIYLLMAQGQKGRSAPLSATVTGNGSTAARLVIDTKQVIEGRVVNGNGKPVVRAIVKLMAIPTGDEGRKRGRDVFNAPGGLLMEAAREILPEIIPETTFAVTATDGSFKIPAWRQARLRVEAQGYSHFDFNLSKLEDEKKPVLQIHRPGGISGYLIDAVGKKPVQFSLVRAEQRNDDSFMEVSEAASRPLALSDENDNHNHVESQPTGPEWLKEGEQLLPAAESWRQQVSASTFVDDPRGRFKVTNLAPGTWTITAQAEGYRTTKSENITVKEDEITKGVILNLDHGASVSGRVVEAGTDRAIAGAIVTAGHGEESGFMAMLQGMGESVAMAETDDDGSFTLTGAESGSDHVNVLANGYASSSLKIEGLEDFEERTGVVVEVPFGGTLTGHIYDRNNNPLPGRMVGAVSMQAKDFQQTAANADGIYRMDNLRPGSYILITAALDDESLFTGDVMTMLSGSRITTASIRENQVTELDIIDFSAGGCRLEGEILDRGIPVPNANIALMKADRGGILDFGFSTARSDENGKFLFKSLEPGEYRAQIDTGDWNGAIEMEVMDAPEDYVVLEIPTSTIRGRLVAAGSGEPVSEARLSLSGIGGSSSTMAIMFGQSGSSPSAWTQSKEDGSFEFERVAPGRYQLKIRSGENSSGQSVGGHTTDTFTLREGDIQNLGDIALPVAGKIEISVVFAGGDGRRWFQVEAWPSGEERETNPRERKTAWGSSRRGDESMPTATLSGLLPGEWDIEVSADGWASAKLLGVSVAGGETVKKKITLSLGGELLVAVYDANGEAAFADNMVLLNGAREQVGEQNIGEVPLAFRSFIPAGEAEMGSHPPGVYILRATLNGITQEVSVLLRAGEESKMEIRF